MKKILLFILASLLFLLAGCAAGQNVPAENTESRTRALLMGCDHFLTQPDTAPVSENNVKTMETALLNGFTAEEDTASVINGISSAEELENAVEDYLGAAGQEDVSLVYISTHGLLPEDGDVSGMTLVFSDGKTETGIPPVQLRQILDRIPGHKVLILDTCYSGAVIGKGTGQQVPNAFASEDYTVITSCGGEEKSWFWSSSGEADNGTGYFTGALARLLSEDTEETVDLVSLKRELRELCGASTVQTWPENPVNSRLKRSGEAAKTEKNALTVTGFSFENGSLTVEDPVIRFSFRALTDIRMIYRIVYYGSGGWEFDNAGFLFDETEGGGFPGQVSPGFKERALSLGSQPEGNSGYALLQIIAMDRTGSTLTATHLLCVPPAMGDPGLEITVPERFLPEENEEGSFYVRHAFPCELTVGIRNDAGQTMTYLAVDEPSRPQGIDPEKAFFCWDGRGRNGEPAPAGSYRIFARTRIGTTEWETVSEAFELIR